MAMRAKFRVASVARESEGKDRNGRESIALRVRLVPGRPSADAATPHGEITLWMPQSAGAVDAFELGSEHYVDFTRAGRGESRGASRTAPTGGNLDEPMMQFFVYSHLPEHLQPVSRPFNELAQLLVVTLPRNPERTVALRKLLEAKDAAVRAMIAV